MNNVNRTTIILLSLILSTALILSTGCTTAPYADGTSSPNQQTQQSSKTKIEKTVDATETTTEVGSKKHSALHPYSQERIADALSTIDSRIADNFIGEDGLFQIVNPDSEYFNENWYKGYAGMFTQEDINGKTIGGYEINPPMQIFGSWSNDGREYFERVEDEFFNFYGMTPSSSLYKMALGRQLMGISRYLEETPYKELDTEYREMIMADDELSVDEKLELIIKNHKGYIRNLEIGELAMENATELTRGEAEELFYDFYGEETFMTSPFTYYSGKNKEVRSFERIYHYDENVFISYDLEFAEDSTGEEFVEQIVSSFEILKHRLPLIYADILTPNEYYLKINLIDSGHNAAATSYYAMKKGKIDFYPEYYINMSKEYSGKKMNEHIISVLLHELIHSSIKSEQMHDFANANERFHEIIDTFEEDGKKSEILTTSSQTYLTELINMSYAMGGSAPISVWYSVYNSSKIWDGLNPMDYYIRIIDNRLLE